MKMKLKLKMKFEDGGLKEERGVEIRVPGMSGINEADKWQPDHGMSKGSVPATTAPDPVTHVNQSNDNHVYIQDQSWVTLLSLGLRQRTEV